MHEHYQCHSCHTTFEITEHVWKCTECGGLLDLVKEDRNIDPSKFNDHRASMWRYEDTLPFNQDSTVWQSITMGEGITPLIPLDESEPHTYVKVDYMMPTLSFKDRGTAVLISKATELGVTKVIADSSGNAGTSIAAYVKRAGIACDIYLRAATSPKKIAQVKAHGATIHTIDGSREDIAAAAQEAVAKEQIFYASHIFNPYFNEGTKTYAFEIWEDLKGAPDSLIIPVGNGTLLLGAHLGFKELYESGLIEKMPKIIAVQAENCAPLAKAFANHEKVATPVENRRTLAEGIASAAPARSEQILEAVREINGEFITANEEDIKEARAALASKGFYVEPTTAISYAAYLKYHREPDETIIIPFTGAGIKAN